MGIAAWAMVLELRVVWAEERGDEDASLGDLMNARAMVYMLWKIGTATCIVLHSIVLCFGLLLRHFVSLFILFCVLYLFADVYFVLGDALHCKCFLLTTIYF